jgi:hypothetical protein
MRGMKSLTIAIILLLAIKISSAQYSLTFCENVNDDGKALHPSNSFMISPNGSALKFLVKADDGFKTDDMDFKIFYINDSGKEEEISKLPQKVEPKWNYTWKEVVFFDAGTYRVKVYDSKGVYLTSANINVRQQ